MTHEGHGVGWRRDYESILLLNCKRVDSVLGCVRFVWVGWDRVGGEAWGWWWSMDECVGGGGVGELGRWVSNHLA